MNCANCQSPTTNPKFCSRSCSTAYNNSVSPKRKRSGKNNYTCIDCGATKSHAGERCLKCRKLNNRESWAAKTLTDIYGESGNSRFSDVGYVRVLARETYFEHHPKECLICGYSLHVEVCHIVGIAEFPRTATVAEVNKLSNLAGLCRNHHWELDNGYLDKRALRDSNPQSPDS